MKSKTLKEIDRLINPPHLKEFRRFQNSIPSFTSQQSAIENAMAALTMPSAANEALQSFASQQSAIGNAMAALTMPSAANEALRSSASQQSAIGNAMAALTMPSAANEALQSFASQQSAIGNAMAALTMPSVIDEVLRSVSAHQFALEATVRRFAEASTATAILVEPDFLLKITSFISDIDFRSIDTTNVENDLVISEEKLNSVNDRSSFLKVYSNLPPYIKLILCIVLLFFLIPQIQDKSASLSPSIVEEHKKG